MEIRKENIILRKWKRLLDGLICARKITPSIDQITSWQWAANSVCNAHEGRLVRHRWLQGATTATGWLPGKQNVHPTTLFQAAYSLYAVDSTFHTSKYWNSVTLNNYFLSIIQVQYFFLQCLMELHMGLRTSHTFLEHKSPELGVTKLF